jgi:hypothetical protein
MISHLLFLGAGISNSLLFYIFKVLQLCGGGGRGDITYRILAEDIKGGNNSENSV